MQRSMVHGPCHDENSPWNDDGHYIKCGCRVQDTPWCDECEDEIVNCPHWKEGNGD